MLSILGPFTVSCIKESYYTCSGSCPLQKIESAFFKLQALGCRTCAYLWWCVSRRFSRSLINTIYKLISQSTIVQSSINRWYSTSGFPLLQLFSQREPTLASTDRRADTPLPAQNKQKANPINGDNWRLSRHSQTNCLVGECKKSK